MHSYVANWVVEYDLDKFENNCTGSQDITINDGMIQTVEADFYGMKYRFSTPIMSKQCHDSLRWLLSLIFSNFWARRLMMTFVESTQRDLYFWRKFKNCFPQRLKVFQGGPCLDLSVVLFVNSVRSITKYPHTQAQIMVIATRTHSSSTFLEAKHFSSCQS